MRLARATGRPLREITKQSYALTLYALWHLDRLDAERRHVDGFVQAMARHELARLVAFAYHEPKRLEPMRQDLITEEQRRVDGKPAATTPNERDTAARAAVDLLNKAHAVPAWTPIEPPK